MFSRYDQGMNTRPETPRPKQFRKKPVTIEAVALTRKNVREVAAWCGGRVVEDSKPSDPSDVYLGLDIPTLEGVMRGETMDSSGRYSHGDWIIKGVNGEFYPCKPDVFAATYEEADQ